MEEGGGEERTDCWEGKMKREGRSWWKNSGNPAVVESQAHSASALQKKKKNMSLRVFHSLLLLLLLFDSSFPNYAHSPF